MFEPLNFQRKAIDTLKEKFKALWDEKGRQLPLVFKAPTGSGKTFMVAHFLQSLNQLPDWDKDRVFIWITFSDDISMQSREKFQKYFENTLENKLLTVANIVNGKLKKNEILFLNWQKLVFKNEENNRLLKLRRPQNIEERKEQGYYFDDLVENTLNDNKEIILIVDEAHLHSETILAKEIKDLINPKIILYITATPSNEIELASRRLNSFVEVDRREVIAEGMIKEKIVVQTEEDLIKYGAKDLDEILIDLGINKRKEIVEEYKKLEKGINPLVIIQLPNDDKKLLEQGQKTKEEIVENLLIEKGIAKDRIAKWFENHPRPEHLEENEDKHEFLLFKQAAGTGWDCPRAHILVMFREIDSKTFYIQTVGRILRMPEPNKKDDYKNSTLIKTGFLFTNYERNKVSSKWNEVSPNKPEINCARIKKGINNVHLNSEYISKVDYGDIADSVKFQSSFIESMNNYFGIEQDKLSDKQINAEKLSKKGIELSPKITNQMMVEIEFNNFEQSTLELNQQGKDIEVEMSENDLAKTFAFLCYSELKEQTEEEAKLSNIARSWGPLKNDIRVWFKKVLDTSTSDCYKIVINDLSKGPSGILRPAITQAIKNYKPILKEILKIREKRQEQRGSTIFEIKNEYWFTDDWEEVKKNLYVLDKYYRRKDKTAGDKNEAEFSNYIDNKKDKIEWWFKNGDEGSEYFALKFYDSELKSPRLFYPDWIIKFKNGDIGIFDTKAGNTANSQDTKDKAKALALKLKTFGKNFIGGIAVKENGIWYYNNSENYDYSLVSLNEDWKKMEDLFKTS